MKQSFKTGFGFGSTSGVITTLGLIVGLHSGTNSETAVLGGILIIAITDALSDAFGIHLSEELNKKNTKREVWESTISTFFSKFLVAFTFIIPVLFLPLFQAIIVSVLWGLVLISFLSFYIAKQQKENSQKVVLEHLSIAIFVVIIAHYLGDLVATFD
ncbi:MAG TPA: hypothetical protein P5570_00280 [Candidatus Paceibacterota bacterium]|nr:hypothetical protein [Candidatus Paceibacterota bacterium]